jgi:hypothetical protein
VIVADPPKGVKTSRKKKMNTSDIRFYDEWIFSIIRRSYVRSFVHS